MARRGTTHGQVLTRQASGKIESKAELKNRPKENGRDLRRVKVLKAGAYFGEMSLIDEEGLASAHVVAESVVEVQALLRHDFLNVMRDHPSLELAINRAIGQAKYVELDDDDDIVHRRVELQQVAQRTLALLFSSSALPSLLTLAASSFLLCKVIVDIPLFSCCSARVIKDVLARLKLTNFEDGETILSKVSSSATLGAQYRSQWCIT